ncbi:MAG: tRNA pseudouridine(38-40) synthase TruA [Gammaproteobacteria bacterium]|nr:tRNA pseudouridine(38-40) synthase TruA [Gammaproteobacteria bacterium]
MTFEKPLDQDFPIAPGHVRIAASVEYNGSRFNGWQIQRGRDDRTVQGVLDRALSLIANENVISHCSGRTDSGVHGTNQIVHFDTTSNRPLKAWVQGVNAQLPDDVSVRWAHVVDSRFHARFAARWRTYRYLVHESPARPVHSAGMALWSKQQLNIVAMNEACQFLLGEQDFTSFRGAGCQSITPMRNVMSAQWYRQGPFCVFEVKANAFVLHMVRNFVGSLMDVGLERQCPSWIGDLLECKDRNQAGVTARPDGLYLVDVGYPDFIELPAISRGPFFLENCL